MIGLAQKIQEAVVAGWARKSRVYPCHVNRASEAGHPCARYLTYCRTHWQVRKPPEAKLQAIFDGGNRIEEQAAQELKDAGFEIREQQVPMEDKSLELTGHLDFMLGVDDVAYPTEVKGLVHHEWDRIKTVPDMFRAKRIWTRKYPAQLLLYLWMKGIPEGIFYLKSKLTFEGKAIMCHWEDHVDYLDGVLGRLRLVNEHIKAGTTPEPMDYDPAACDECPFLALCGPERKMGADLTFETNDTLIALLARREELKPMSKEYEMVDSEIKALIGQREKVSCGDWLITGKFVEKKEYTVPAGRYWQTRIARLK